MSEQRYWEHEQRQEEGRNLFENDMNRATIKGMAEEIRRLKQELWLRDLEIAKLKGLQR